MSNIPYGLVQSTDRGKFRIVWNNGRGHGGCSGPMTEDEAHASLRDGAHKKIKRARGKI